jgi:prepilin-type N-terminal cleavage/methylation domain-containing protein/prepilin-type processing-associated H-X9-DG protein
MKSRAFTLIELLVVISIIALLATLLLPSVSLVRNQAKSLSCQNRLRQVGLCFLNYSIDNRGSFPWGAVGNDWSVWYKAITGTNTGESGIANYNASGASEWGNLFFCTEDKSGPTTNASVIGWGAARIFWDIYTVSHGYNSHGLGGTGHASFNNRAEYNRPARLSEFNNASQTILSGDTRSWAGGRHIVEAGHALMANDAPLGAYNATATLYPRHRGRTANILMVDGHVNGITASGVGDYASLYSETQLGLQHRFSTLDNMWNRQ